MTSTAANSKADNKKRSSSEKTIDGGFIWLTRILAFAIAGVLLWIAIQVGIQAVPAIKEFGLSFLTGSAWNPPEKQYAILPMIYGTVVSSLIALLIGFPIGVACAIVLSEDFLPKSVRRTLVFLVELLAANIDPVEVRRRIGMVFQKPNPFPKSIYENIAYGARINGYKGNMDDLVEKSLRQAAIWDEVKDKLKQNGLSLSGGQQQRLCIARAVALSPDVVLMDEPCSSLDPVSTSKVEDLIHDLRGEYTIIIVTHNMQQATRVAGMTAFFNAEAGDSGSCFGYLVEYDKTENIFENPQEESTQKYVSRHFG